MRAYRPRRMKASSYRTDAQLTRVVAWCRLLESAGTLPEGNAGSFLGRIADYVLNEEYLQAPTAQWHVLYERLRKCYPKEVDRR